MCEIVSYLCRNSIAVKGQEKNDVVKDESKNQGPFLTDHSRSSEYRVYGCAIPLLYEAPFETKRHNIYRKVKI